MPDQIGNPFGVLHIRLAARHVADVPGVADDELETPFEHGIDGLPVDAGALHPDMGHAQAQQPLAQRFQITCHRPEGAHLLGRALSRFPNEDAGHHRLLVNVQPGHSLDHHPHARLRIRTGDRGAAGTFETLPRVLPGPRGNKEWYLCAARAGLLIGVASHRRFASLDTITVERFGQTGPQRHHFHP